MTVQAGIKSVAMPALDLEHITNNYFAAWRDRDPARIVTMHTPDTRFELHVGMPAVTGREAVQQAFARYFEQWPGFSFDVHRVVLGPDHWVLDWTMRSTITRNVDRRAVTTDIQIGCLDLVVLSPEGLVARKDTFVDVAHLRAAMSALGA